jgi:hypothetical protein
VCCVELSVSAAVVLAAALAQRMALPQTACLALSGRLPVPETDGGRMWYTTFEDDGEFIQVIGDIFSGLIF